MGSQAAAPSGDQSILSNAMHRQSFGHLNQADWLRVLLRSMRADEVDGVPMPAFPSSDLQVATHGTNGRGALQEAHRFTQLVERYCRQECRPIVASTRVLDFGCGWGRMLRLFLNRVDSHHLYGVDVRPDVVALARQLNPFAQFSVVEPVQRLPFADGWFDLVIAYSVFSHLNEATSRAWVAELARVLKPGGLAILTTQDSGFLDFVKSLTTWKPLWRIRFALARAMGRPGCENWLKGLVNAFADIDAAKQRIAAGQFVHASTGGGSELESSFYGETIIPRAYVEREWREFDLIDFVAGHGRSAQAVIVLRKPLSA